MRAEQAEGGLNKRVDAGLRAVAGVVLLDDVQAREGVLGADGVLAHSHHPTDPCSSQRSASSRSSSRRSSSTTNGQRREHGPWLLVGSSVWTDSTASEGEKLWRDTYSASSRIAPVLPSTCATAS